MINLKNALLLTIIILTAAFNSLAQNYSNQNLILQAEQISGDKFIVQKKTSKGATVYGTKKPSREMMAAIDKGLSDLFAIAKKNGYYNRLNYSNYTIFVANPDRLTDSDGNYIPNFAVPVHQYAGTDYDKGGFMYVAGMVISNDPCAFIIAENTKKLEQVSEVVRYEGEHLILFHNDRKRYNETADHSKGGGHPILN